MIPLRRVTRESLARGGNDDRGSTMKNNRKLSRLALSAALGLAAYGTAIDTRAQTVNTGVSIGPSEALAPPGQPTAPAPEHLFGDPGGIRAKLGNYGVNIILDWTAEVAGNVTGGVKQGATYAGQIGFEADIDWQKLAGIPGLSTHTVIVNRQGTNVGTLFGDNLNQVQEIYGAGGDVALHLVYTYAQESLAGGRVDIAVGPDARLERLCRLAVELQLHEQLALRQPQGATRERHRDEFVSGCRLGRPGARGGRRRTPTSRPASTR